MSRKTIVLYHRADFDGLFCYQIAKRFYGDDAEYIGWDYGDPTPQVDDETHLVMLDISIDGLMNHPRLNWVDHHKSAMDKYGVKLGYQIDGVAACRLAWQYFGGVNSWPFSGYPTKQDFIDHKVYEPTAVRLAGEYDIWDKRDPRAELFQHGLRSRELTDTVWKGLLSEFNAGLIEMLLEAGKVVAYVREQEYAQVIKEQGFTMEWEGLTFLCCNSHELDICSHLFVEGIKPEHDALLGFTWNGIGNSCRVSMYGVPGKPDVDVSKIAVKYGGGGHQQACGFKTSTLPFNL